LLRADRALVDMRVETMIRETLSTIAGETRRVDDSGRETAPSLSVTDIESIADRFSGSASEGIISETSGDEDV
jgi:hypothetical protein